MSLLICQGLWRRGHIVCQSNLLSRYALKVQPPRYGETMQSQTSSITGVLREGHTIKVHEDMSTNQIVNRLTRHVISVGTVQKLQEQQYFEKRHQKAKRRKQTSLAWGTNSVSRLSTEQGAEAPAVRLRRRLASQKKRNAQLRKVQEMANWTEYLNAKGVSLPLRKGRTKWV